MKKIALISAIALSGLLYNSASAQLRIRVGLHLGVRPVYVPARVVVVQQPAEYVEPANYDGDDDYFYLPDVDAYYSVPEQCYYYEDGGRWISAAYLPGLYRDYDWRTARRFEVRAPRPFMHNEYYRTRYSGIAFNARWNDRVYHDNYVVRNHNNYDRYRNNDQRFDNNRGNGYNRQHNEGRNDQNFNRGRGHDDHGATQNHQGHNIGGGQEHFAQNNASRNSNHRPARF